tara:strand:+ start:197 stop:1138 length:942 start_codon:yes stop_codon:yes gene_type:complete
MAWIKTEGEVLPGIINIGDSYLSSYLIVGSEKILLVDSNMSFMSSVLRQNIQSYLPNGRQLDGVLLTHSHFDHVGGIPYLREMFPDLVVYGSPVAAKVLQSDNAKRLILDLNMQAAREYAKAGMHLLDIAYDESLLVVDHVVKDGDEISIGNETITIIEVPGHTRCSICYFLSDQKAIFGGESMGVLLKNGTVCPEYLSSYVDYNQSLKKCKSVGAEIVCMPHFGVLTEQDAANYWDLAIRWAEGGAEIILSMLREGHGKAQIIQKLKEMFYLEDLRSFQPEKAFDINAGRSIQLIMEDFAVTEGTLLRFASQ